MRKSFQKITATLAAMTFFISQLLFPVPPVFSSTETRDAFTNLSTVPEIPAESVLAPSTADTSELPSGSVFSIDSPLSESNRLLIDELTQDLVVNVYEGGSIQSAINSAQAGDTVLVHSGTYHERILLKQGVHLQGENAATTILNGDFGTGESLIRALGNNVIEGLTLTGAKGSASAIQIQGDHVEVLQNRIQDNLSVGIDISAGLSDVRIEQNLFLRNQTAIQNAQTGNQIQFNTITGPETVPVVKDAKLNYLAAQGVRLDIQNVPGVYSYYIEYTDSLGGSWRRAQVQVGGVWTDLKIPASAGAVTMWLDDGSATEVSPLTIPMRFYRVKAAETSSAGIGINVAAAQAPIIQNNIITHQQIQSIWEMDSSSLAAQIRNNVVFNNQESGAGTGHLPAAISPKTGEHWTGGNILANPQFQNPANNDYSVLPISPAYGAGALLPESLKVALLRAASIHRRSNAVYSIEKISSSGVLTGWRILYNEGSSEAFYLDGTQALDTTGPAVTILSSLTLTNQSNYLLRYSVEGVEKSENRTLAEGSNILKAEAEDIFGNKTTKILEVTLDTVPPAVTLTSEIVVSQSNYILAWKVDGGSEQTRTVALQSGDNALSVQAFDLAGNEKTVVFHIFFLGPVQGHSFTNTGVVIDSTKSVFGGTSGYFSGTNSYLSLAPNTDWALGAGDFTIDLRVRSDALPAAGKYQALVSQWVTGQKSFMMFLNNDGGVYTLGFFYSKDGNIAMGPKFEVPAPLLQTWHHVAAVRSGTDLKINFDGTQLGVFNVGTDAFFNASSPLMIGAANLGATHPFTGNLDEVRVSQGARWTGSNFILPAQEYARDDDTRLLLHFTQEEFQNQSEMLLPPDPRAVAAPTLQTIPAYTNQNQILLSGDKPANTSIWINGVQAVASDAQTTWSFSYPLSGAGAHSLSIVAKNTYNFSSNAVNASITVDTAAPTGQFLINGGNASTTSYFVALSLTLQDSISGLSQMRFSTDGGLTWSNWEAYAVSKNLTLPLGNGNKEVRAQIKDQAGNVGDFSSSIIMNTLVSFATKQGVRKVIVLGPETDVSGNPLTYAFTPSSNLALNGQFFLNRNQLTYLPNSSFVGSGTIAVDAGAAGQIVLNLQVTAPQINPPNDPLLSSQYGLGLTNAVRAWNLSKGAGVTVAIIDTGINTVHADLNDNIYTNPGEIAGDSIDNDGNGYVNDVHGWDFEHGVNTTTDNADHGTHVAGIVGAESQNGIGGTGIAPSVKLMPLKVVDLDSSDINRVFQNIVNAINYAVHLGVRVINISLDWLISEINASITTALQNAINAARQAGAVVVVAAGNNNTDVGLYSPAALGGVITVSATNALDQKACCDDQGNYFSNYGTQVDVAAPGERILSTYYDFGSLYAEGTGTSMASPFVAGLAALMISQDPSITDSDVMRRLKFSSKDLGAAGWDPYFGYGRIDAFKALSYDYYDDGTIKTQWLETPDENGWRRLNFDASGYLIGGSFSAISSLSFTNLESENSLPSTALSSQVETLSSQNLLNARPHGVFPVFVPRASENKQQFVNHEDVNFLSDFSWYDPSVSPAKGRFVKSRKAILRPRLGVAMENPHQETKFSLQTVFVQRLFQGVRALPQFSWLESWVI